jgi:hypothetical protein
MIFPQTTRTVAWLATLTAIGITLCNHNRRAEVHWWPKVATSGIPIQSVDAIFQCHQAELPPEQTRVTDEGVRSSTFIFGPAIHLRLLLQTAACKQHWTSIAPPKMKLEDLTPDPLRR